MSAVICVDVVGRPRQHVGARHPDGLGIGQEGRQVALGDDLDGLAGGGGAADDLVVDVGDVHDPGHRVAAPAQVADEQVGEQERAEVADVGRSVDGRAARVDTDPVAGAAARTGGSRPTACRGGEGSPDRLDRGDDERGDRPPRALGPVEIAARGLDADRVAIQPEQRCDRVAHRSEVGARGAVGRR